MNMAYRLALWLCFCFSMGAQTAEEHAARAEQFLSQRDLKSAEAELRKAVELAPQDATLSGTLGGVLGLEGDLRGAHSYLAHAVELVPSDPMLRRNLAANQWQLGLLPEARQNLELLVRTDPTDKVSVFLLGMVSEAQKNYPRSIELFESIPELLAQKPEAQMALASSYYHTGNPEKAQPLLRSILHSRAAPNVLLRTGRMAMNAGDYVFAAAALSDLVQNGPPNEEAFYLLAVAFRKQGALSRALVVATHGTKAFPQSADILLEKASIEGSFQFFTDAVATYRRIEQISGLKPETAAAVTQRLAFAEWRAGMKKEAATDFESALRRFPHDELAFEEYGALLLDDGQPEDHARAIQLLKTAITLSATDPEPRYRLGNDDLLAGRAARALPYLEAAARLEPHSSKIHYALSRAYRRLGRTAEAEHELDTYQRLKAAETQPPEQRLALGTGVSP